MQSWQRRVFGVVGTACLVFASSCQGGVDEPAASGPVATAAATNETSAPASVTSPESIEASEPITSTTATSTTKPALPTTTTLELEEAAAPEADDSAEVEEADELETDKSDEAEEAVADEAESATEQPAEPPPLCHELEFDPDDAAEFASNDWSIAQPFEASDESHEVTAAFSRYSDYAAAAAHDRDGRYRTRKEAYEPQTVTVHITDSEGRTVQHKLPLDSPEALPYPLHYAVIPEALIIGPRGWVFAASGIVYMNVRELIPGNFDEWAPSIEWVSDLPSREPRQRHETDGLYLSYIVDGGRGWSECFVSFDALGITQADWWRYGTRSMDGYLHVDEYRALIWHAEWDGTPVRSDLPENSGECCELFALSSGYAITTNETLHGYGPRAYWPPSIFYSPDGNQWRRVVLPTSDLPEAEGEGVWVCRFEEVNAAIRIIEGRSLYFDSLGPCEEIREWIADPDFNNWRLLEPES